MLRQIFGALVSAAEQKATELGINGFLVVADFVEHVVLYAFVNCEPSSAVRDDHDGNGSYNIVSIAFSKLGMTLVRGKDTGYPTGVAGEVPWQGGHISGNKRYGYAFSGGPQEKDLQLAVHLESVHLSLASSYPVELIDYNTLAAKISAAADHERVGIVAETFLSLPPLEWRSELRYFWVALHNAARLTDDRRSPSTAWGWVMKQSMFPKALGLPAGFLNDDRRKSKEMELPMIGHKDDVPFAA